MLTFLPFEGYYSFFLKDFKSVLCTLNLLKLSSVIGRRQFPKGHTVHTYKCHIIQYGLGFFCCEFDERDLIALSGISP